MSLLASSLVSRRVDGQSELILQNLPAKDSAEYQAVRSLVVAISASENQKGQRLIQNFAEFEERLNALGLGHLEILLSMAYLDIGFVDRCILTDDAMEQFERQIHAILFPNIEFGWQKYCEARQLDINFPDAKWRNKKCDVQAMWSHIDNRRDIFVTSDANFHSPAKKRALIALGAGRIETPTDALSLL